MVLSWKSATLAPSGQKTKSLRILQVGVRDLFARGYFIPGGASQRGGGRAPAFRVARCQTPSGVRVDGLGWVPSGPVRIRQIDTDRYGSIVLSLGYRWATDPVGLAFGWDSIRIEIEPVTTELRDVCIAFCILPSYHLGVARVSGFKASDCFWVS